MLNKKYNVIISDRAAHMLVNHVKFLAQVSPNAANKLRKQIMDGAHRLAQMPERYPWLCCDEIPANKYRKMIVAGRYLLIYQIRDNNVFVDYIADCRQDYSWLI